MVTQLTGNRLTAVVGQGIVMLDWMKILLVCNSVRKLSLLPNSRTIFLVFLLPVNISAIIRSPFFYQTYQWHVQTLHTKHFWMLFIS